jgi:hypothetical protein
MKTYYYNILTMLAIVLCGLSLTSCGDNDDLNTDQYGNEVALNVFGPCPVLRGGTLHFLGSNLDQISEIDIPGADPITQIEVIKAGRESEITIQVPAEKCAPGIITLKTAKGGVIETKTPITYREDISVGKVFIGTENNLTGNVGDILTIKGDYLNLLHGIIFADKDTVREDKFIAHDRYTIQVAIPAEAKSGKFILTDLAETPTELESEDAITINLPTTSNVSNETPKAGQTITITGVSLNQIAAVKLNGAELTADDLTISEDGKSLSFVVPATATDGEITLITKSGVSIPAGEIETVVPTELSVAPEPIKNGATITISGKDLDLVTGITFPNTESSAPATVNATTVTAVVPVKAQEGDITLSLANGKTVTVAYTLVKPTVTSFTPETLMAGNKVMIKGTDLDLVESVTFPGETPVTASKEDTKITATAIGTVVPTAAVGSGCTLNLKNGTTVSVTGLTITAATDPVLSETAEGVIGEYVTIKGKNFNNAERIYIGTTKVTKIKSRSNEEITFQIPTTIEKGEYTIYFYGTDDTKYTGGTIKVNPAEVTIWEGSFNNGEWAGNQDLAWGGYDWSKVKVGQVLTFYCTANDPAAEWCCVDVRQGTEWKNLDGDHQLNGNGSTTTLTYTISAAALKQLINNGGLVFTGTGMTITKVTLK